MEYNTSQGVYWNNNGGAVLNTYQAGALDYTLSSGASDNLQQASDSRHKWNIVLNCEENEQSNSHTNTASLQNSNRKCGLQFPVGIEVNKLEGITTVGSYYYEPDPAPPPQPTPQLRPERTDNFHSLERDNMQNYKVSLTLEAPEKTDRYQPHTAQTESYVSSNIPLYNPKTNNHHTRFKSSPSSGSHVPGKTIYQKSVSTNHPSKRVFQHRLSTTPGIPNDPISLQQPALKTYPQTPHHSQLIISTHDQATSTGPGILHQPNPTSGTSQPANFPNVPPPTYSSLLDGTATGVHRPGQAPFRTVLERTQAHVTNKYQQPVEFQTAPATLSFPNGIPQGRYNPTGVSHVATQYTPPVEIIRLMQPNRQDMAVQADGGDDFTQPSVIHDIVTSNQNNAVQVDMNGVSRDTEVHDGDTGPYHNAQKSNTQTQGTSQQNDTSTSTRTTIELDPVEEDGSNDENDNEVKAEREETLRSQDGTTQCGSNHDVPKDTEPVKAAQSEKQQNIKSMSPLKGSPTLKKNKAGVFGKMRAKVTMKTDKKEKPRAFVAPTWIKDEVYFVEETPK